MLDTIVDREGDARAKFKLDQTLITPYGNFARFTNNRKSFLTLSMADFISSTFSPALPCDLGTAGDIARPKLPLNCSVCSS